MLWPTFLPWRNTWRKQTNSVVLEMVTNFKISRAKYLGGGGVFLWWWEETNHLKKVEWTWKLDTTIDFSWSSDAVSYKFMSLIQGACTWLWSTESGFLSRKERPIHFGHYCLWNCEGTVRTYRWNHSIPQSRPLNYLEVINTQVEGP